MNTVAPIDIPTFTHMMDVPVERLQKLGKRVSANALRKKYSTPTVSDVVPNPRGLRVRVPSTA